MPSSEVHLTPRFLRSAKKLSQEERKSVQLAIDQAEAAWGSPHAHSGAGIRRLRKSVFECRCGLALRLVFLAEPKAFTFFVLGNHDEIQSLIWPPHPFPCAGPS